MKIPSSFLFDLVHSLSKSEKRYIKLRAGEKDKNYLQLMDALLAQKTFDESALAEACQGANFLKHLSVNKRYLYEYILRSLARFGQQKLEDKVWERMSAARVLMGKGLYRAAASELSKGQKTAERFELFPLRILIGGMEKELLTMRRPDAKDEQALRRIFETENECLSQIRNTNTYWYLARRFAIFQMRFQKIQNAEQREYIEGLARSPEFQDIRLATNFRSQLYFHQANATYRFIQGDAARAYEINTRFLDLLDSQPRFLKPYAERYLATLNNLLIDSLIIGKYNLLKEGIQRLARTPERPAFKFIKNIESRVFRQRYLLLLNWSVRQKDWAKALEWIPDIEKGLGRFKEIEKHHRITFYYLIAYILFLNRRPDQALRWNNRILNDPKEDVVREIFHFARSLNLLIHYELGNDGLLESLLQSTPKFLKARRVLYATEKALFRYLNKSLQAANAKEKRRLTEDFKAELPALYQQPKERRVFNYLDLMAWLEAG